MWQPSAGLLHAKTENPSKGIRPDDAKAYSYDCDGLTAPKRFSHCHLIIQWNYLSLLGYVTVTKWGGVTRRYASVIYRTASRIC